MKRNARFLLLIYLVGVLPLHTSAQSLSRQPTRRQVYVFVYDAGETLGLLPVAPLLKAKNIQVHWGPLTPWAQRILERDNADVVPLPPDVEQMPHIKDRMDESNISYWLPLTLDRKPDLVIFGMVSAVQESLARECKKRGIRTAAFYDSFDPTTRDSIMWRVGKQVDEVWAPSEKILRNLHSLGIANVKVLGQPTLETWRNAEVKLDRNKSYERLGLPKASQFVLFAGQYGEGYQEILEAFVRAAKIALSSRKDFWVILSPHPKTDGKLERAAARKFGNDRFIVRPSEVATADLAIASRAVITWRSTVGYQAAFVGKPVIYFNFNLEDYRNDLIDCGLALSSTPQTFGAELQTALELHRDRSVIHAKLIQLGYVMGSDHMIASEIERALQTSPNRTR